MRADEFEGPPRMTLRVYRVDGDGKRVAEVSSRDVWARERPPEFNSIAFPPCECPMCRAERQEERALTTAALQRIGVRPSPE